MGSKKSNEKPLNKKQEMHLKTLKVYLSKKIKNGTTND